MIKSKDLLIYFLILTCFFIFLEISLFIQYYKDFLSDFSFVSASIHLPITVFFALGKFIVIQLLIHFVYCLLVWGIVYGNLYLIHSTELAKYSFIFAMSCWFLYVFTILLGNSIYFPNSNFAQFFDFLLWNAAIGKSVWLFLLSCCSVLFFTGLRGLLLRFSLLSSKLMITLSITLIIFYSGLQMKQPVARDIFQQANHIKPNIIVVGIDSLRPDFLSYWGGEANTPFINSFLQQAVLFREAVTPLARTFPSWTSLLTGRYPKEIGIRSNLAQQKNVNFSNSLPLILQQQGYQTIYATDETRFSNITQQLGFDRLITPPEGLNDFLIGTMNDFPLSNMLVNTVLGQWLFPYSYANRPAYVTYQPETFLKLLHSNLKQMNGQQPLFLAVHFCLPHHPYVWAEFAGKELQPIERYTQSIAEADKQLAAFFNLLQEDHLLNNTIVVLLSDHGEALALPGDRITEENLFLRDRASASIPQFYPKDGQQAVNQSVGHGTDVLGLSQYHTLLAFRFYGDKKYFPREITGPVSLLDIKPSLLDLIHAPIKAASGQSLANIIKAKHENKIIHHQPIYIESDFSPPAIQTVYPDIHDVLLQGIKIFQVESGTMRLIVRDDMNQMIIRSKQYAIINGAWMLALYPQNKQQRMPILINLNTGIWTNNINSHYARDASAKDLLNLLKMFYRDELSTY